MKYAEIIICLTGLALLAYWLLKTSLGRKALADSVPRRNNMPLYLPFVPFFIWFVVVSLAVIIAKELAKDLPDWQSSVLENVVFCLGATITAAVIIVLAWAHFARRLKGFGLDLRTFPRDLLAAPLYLLAVWPLIMAAIWLTIYFAQQASGHDYQMQPHQQLEIAAQHPQLALRVLIFIGAVVIGPLFEELMFRGLIQTMMRSFLFQVGNRAWLAIVFSSGLFVIMHQDMGHWPALFVLGVCMGYAYEKSGSLWRPIFIHAIFNATAVIATLSK
ncbi:MAG: CPBP family intramembrane glutamic endopeptidase [Planctomycetota bacterium]|nr:CPBP family intramembrane glutamic endopeptidase [Planctomycetota bacterium]